MERKEEGGMSEVEARYVKRCCVGVFVCDERVEISKQA